jgi:hypothetical protein
MADDSMAKKVIKGLGEIGSETVKETIKQVGEATHAVITGQELFGVKPMSDEDLEKKKSEDKKKVDEEMKNMLGRNVEEEIKQVREEKKREEEERERQSAEQIKQQQTVLETESQTAVPMGNPKREAAKRQFAPGKKKKQQPTADETSQTSEFKGGKID